MVEDETATIPGWFSSAFDGAGAEPPMPLLCTLCGPFQVTTWSMFPGVHAQEVVAETLEGVEIVIQEGVGDGSGAAAERAHEEMVALITLHWLPRRHRTRVPSWV